MQPSTKK